MRRSALILFLLAGCGQNDLPVTGGFRETIVDKSIRHGQQLEVADIDDDGAPDIVAAFSLTDAVHVYLNASEQKFDGISVSGAGSIVALDTVAFDVDGDFDLDVAAIGLSQRIMFNSSAGELAWYENPGDPRGKWVTHPIARPNFADTSSKSDLLPWGGCCIDSGDFDGDGLEDLVIGLRAAQDERGRFYGNRIDWYKNEGNRLFTGPLPVDVALQSVGVVMVDDVDGDGRLDVIGGSDAGELAWYRNEGMVQGGLRFVKYTICDTEAVHGVAYGNIDGDADRELVVAGYSLTSSISLAYFDRPDALGDPWMRTEIDAGFGSNRNERPKVAVADFDGDGTDDIVASSQGGGDLRVYRRTTEGFDRTDVRGGYGGLTGLSVADIDADGKPDIVTSTFEFGSRDRIAWWKNESFPQ